MELFLVAAAVSLFCVMATRATRTKSGTYDEYVHVTAGFTYWQFNDYRLNPENGNLTQRLLALPLLLDHPSFPSLDQTSWKTSNMWEVSDQFFFGSGADPQAMLNRSRLVTTIVAALLALVIYLWARSLFGVPGAWVSLIVFVFSPTMLAQGALATSDLVAAAFFTVSVGLLWRAMHEVTPATVALSTIATGGLFLAKMSALLLLPIAACLCLIRVAIGRPLLTVLGSHRHHWKARREQAAALACVAAAHLAVCVVLIWAAYGFRYSAFAANVTAADRFIDPWSDVLGVGGLPATMIAFAREHKLLPEAFLYGMASVAAYSRHRAAFLNGQVSLGSPSRWFFPYVALVKTTIPALVLLVAVPFSLLARRSSPATAPVDPYELLPLLSLIAIYGVFAVASNLNIGHRHLLPMIPPAIILLGANGCWLGDASRYLTRTRKPAVE